MADFPYIAQADVEAYLGVTLTDNGQNTFTLIQPLMQDLIDEYCSRTWNFKNTVTETFYGNKTTLFVKNPPITTITSITIDGPALDLQYAYDKTHQHVVRIYFRTDEENNAGYGDVLETVADDVIAFQCGNLMLNGTCDWSMPSSGNWEFGEKEVLVRYLELVVTLRARASAKRRNDQ